jgi:hypothetical protein
MAGKQRIEGNAFHLGLIPSGYFRPGADDEEVVGAFHGVGRVAGAGPVRLGRADGRRGGPGFVVQQAGGLGGFVVVHDGGWEEARSWTGHRGT